MPGSTVHSDFHSHHLESPCCPKFTAGRLVNGVLSGEREQEARVLPHFALVGGLVGTPRQPIRSRLQRILRMGESEYENTCSNTDTAFHTFEELIDS